MGMYIYINCERCHEYLHIGKVGGDNFELPYDRLERFLTKHNIHKGCNLTTLNDGYGDSNYCRFIDGVEFL